MMRNSSWKRFSYSAILPILAICSGLLVSSIFLLMRGSSPIEAYSVMFKTGFSCLKQTNCNLFQTLQLATPLILTGLSAVMAFRSGMFSIGQEGQFLIGATIAAWLGYAVHLPALPHILLIIVAAMVGAGIYGWIPAILKVRLNVNEVISTIIFNSLANLFMTYIVNYPFRADQGTTAHSPIINQTAFLEPFFRGAKFGPGFVIALVVAALVFIYLWKSSLGYEQRMSGQSPRFAKYCGIKNGQAALRGMVFSGAIAGLAGAIEVLGVHHRIMQGFSSGLGFDGVMVAILGMSHPIGVTIVAIFFAGMRLGAQIGLQAVMQIPRELGGGIIALIILFVSSQNIFRGFLDRLFRRQSNQTDR